MINSDNKFAVLYLEDDPEWARRIQEYLSGTYIVTVVRHPNDALNLVHKQSFDVFLVDVSLAIGDGSDEQGLRFVKQIREIEKVRKEDVSKMLSARIVMLTAYPYRERIRTAFREYAVSDFLDKGNTSRKDIVQAIKSAIKNEMNL